MGQTGFGGEIEGEPYDPLIHGQWAGPYSLDDHINPNGTDEWAEIVHIVTLPPPNDGKVLIWARRDRDQPDPEGITEPYLTWILDPSNHTPNLVAVPLPNSSGGDRDLFCGAQTLMEGPEGRVLAMGGTDMAQWAGNGVTRGTFSSYEFNNAAPGLGPAWLDHGDPGNGDDFLNNFRYYNGCLRESDGKVHTYGSTGEDEQHVPGRTNRERFNGSTWEVTDNHLGDDCNDLSQLYSIETGNYPDIHLTGSGDWLRVDGGSMYALQKEFCMMSSEEDRFVNWTTPMEVPRRHGNSVHVFGWKNGARVESIYAIGGNDLLGCNGTFSHTVMRMEDPGPGKDWDDTPADLSVPRHTSNTIILLDGSLLTIGGANNPPAPCDPVHEVERYRPHELFFNTPVGQWKQMAPIFHPRTYHSVAALLPDGSVLTAGGVGTNIPMGEHQPSWHSMEIYKPPYFFKPARRPEIISVAASWTYDATFSIALAFLNEWPAEVENTERRAALVSPCSGTHGVDFNQRYIELEDTGFAPSGGGGVLDIRSPLNGNVAPPGMYMLTVLNKDGIPSEAAWVELKE